MLTKIDRICLYINKKCKVNQSSKKKYCPERFCSTSFTDSCLLILGLKLLGSLLKVMPRSSKNLFIPASRVCGELAVVFTEGSPSNTITRSAKYVAIMKSCSTTKPVLLAWMMNLKRNHYVTYMISEKIDMSSKLQL